MPEMTVWSGKCISIKHHDVGMAMLLMPPVYFSLSLSLFRLSPPAAAVQRLPGGELHGAEGVDGADALHGGQRGQRVRLLDPRLRPAHPDGRRGRLRVQPEDLRHQGAGERGGGGGEGGRHLDAADQVQVIFF